MVLLAMTPAVVAAVELYVESDGYDNRLEEPALDAPKVGNPISHGQLVEISKYLKKHPEKAKEKQPDGSCIPIHLSELLRGCAIYNPPPKPKAEPSSEYKKLMARLRKEEEARSYERMLNPTPTVETFAQRFPSASQGHLFPPTQQEPSEEDEMTYADINRQMALIANVLISIIACSVAIWKAAWHWSVPQRLALSMTGSLVVAVAEVAIYAGYIGRLKEAKTKERMKVERKEVAESWIIEARQDSKQSTKSTRKVVSEVPLSGLRLRAGRGET